MKMEKKSVKALAYCSARKPTIAASFKGSSEPVAVTKKEWEAEQPRDDRFVSLDDAKLNDSIFAECEIGSSRLNAETSQLEVDVFLTKAIKKRQLWDAVHAVQGVASDSKSTVGRVMRARRMMSILGWYGEKESDESAHMLVSLTPEESIALLKDGAVTICPTRF